MPNPVTNTGNQITSNHSWYIWTINPYYAANAGNPRDFSTDRTSINATIMSSEDGFSAQEGTNQGIKMIFGPTDKNPAANIDSVPHPNGNAFYLWKPVGDEQNTTGSYYGDGRDYFMHSYSYGTNGGSLITSGSGFGPYELNLTPIPDTGSIMLIATGSDVLIGNNGGNSAYNYTNKDTRAFNVLFWVTGSVNAEILTNKIAGTTPADWGDDDRRAIYAGGYGLFQTAYDADNGTLTWYPGNYSEADTRQIFSWPG